MTNKIFDKLIHISLFAVFCIPLLIPYSYFPVSKFYSEIIVLILALFMAMLMLFRSDKIAISSVGVASFLFAIFLNLQLLTNNIRFPGINMAISLEFLVATLMSIGIVSYIGGNHKKREDLVLMVVWAVLIGVTIQAFYGLMQYTGVAANFKNFILFVDTQGMDVFGNIGQKNDYVDFIAVGVFALSYLYFIRQINIWVFGLYSTFFLGIITITTSRTCFVYFIFAIIAAVIFRTKHRHDQSLKRLFAIIIYLAVMLVLLEAFLPVILSVFRHSSDVVGNGSINPLDSTSGLYRFGTRSVDQATYRRFYEWYKDLIIFIHNPIFGIGWYQYPKEAIYLMETKRFMYIPANQALYTHSHNSPLNILAETGIIGFAISWIYGFGYSIYRMFKNYNNYATLFVVLMILTIFGQSLFQYPLWYAYFLIYFIIFLSLDNPVITWRNSKPLKLAMVAIFIGFSSFVYVNLSVYQQIVNCTQMPNDSDDFASNVMTLTGVVDNNKLWSLPALLVLDNYLMPTVPITDSTMSRKDQQKYIDLLGSELPYSGAILKQIIIHKLNGDDQGSEKYAYLLAHAYPFWKDQFADRLQSSPMFADDITILRQFKFEDRSIFAEMLKKAEKK